MSAAARESLLATRWQIAWFCAHRTNPGSVTYATEAFGILLVFQGTAA